MGETKELDIKNQTYYFLDDMTDIRYFHSNLLKIDNKKLFENDDIYYINYITIKKFSDCKTIHSANPLYLIIHSATEYFNDINGKKYLVIDFTEKHEEVFLELDQKLKRLMMEKNCFMEKIILELGLVLMTIYL